MKKIVFFVLALQILLMPKLFSQNRASHTASDDVVVIAHTVSLGETVRLISQKYLVSPSDIYKRNKFAVEGVSPGMTLQIPIPKDSKVLKTLNLPVVEQPVANLEQTADISTEEEGYIPNNSAAVASREPSSTPIINEHHVKSGETLSGLAKKYGTTIARIEELNPAVKKRGLQIGQTLRISAN